MVSKSKHPITFASLISPLSANDFAHRCELGKPYYLKGTRKKFNGLFDLEAFKLACTSTATISASYSSPKRESMTPSKEINPSEVDQHYSRGATICITGINKVNLRLGRLAQDCKAALRYTGIVDCRAYLSPDNAGYTPHFDDKTVLTLQVEGSKKWRVGKTPAVKYPLNNAGRDPRGKYRYFRNEQNVASWERFSKPHFSKNSTTYKLHPGDILLVPAGVWHSAKADGHSLSIALTLNHVGMGSTREIIFTAIGRYLIADSDWRRTPPMVPVSEQLGDIEKLASLDKFFVSRLESLRNEIDTLLSDRTKIMNVWAERIAVTNDNMRETNEGLHISSPKE